MNYNHDVHRSLILCGWVPTCCTRGTSHRVGWCVCPCVTLLRCGGGVGAFVSGCTCCTGRLTCLILIFSWGTHSVSCHSTSGALGAWKMTSNIKPCNKMSQLNIQAWKIYWWQWNITIHWLIITWKKVWAKFSWWIIWNILIISTKRRTNINTFTLYLSFYLLIIIYNAKQIVAGFAWILPYSLILKIIWIKHLLDMSDRSCLRLCCKILLNSLCMLFVLCLVVYQQGSPVNICKYDNKITGNN